MGITSADLAAEIGGRLVPGIFSAPTAATAPPVAERLTSISHDSRATGPGVVFACIPGANVDGHDFAETAVAAGASALLVQRELALPSGSVVDQVIVADTRRSIGPAAAAVFGHPDRDVTVLGVTGTNGKTTVTQMLGAMLQRLGASVEVMGTLSGVRTTPEAPDLFARLADLRGRSVSYLAMEVSSHALELHRVDGLHFGVGAFTNLSQDHLDFHSTMEDYFEAKARLFTPERSSTAVINVDDPAGERLLERRPDALRYSLADAVQLNAQGPTSFFRWQDLPVEVQMAGTHNVYNALCAARILEALGYDPPDIADAIGAINPIPGRMEWVSIGQSFGVVVDYSHTPDSLGAALAACRNALREDGVVRVVFGCGGDRDPSKRALMGAVAVASADDVVITSDNPRSEDPQLIIDQILTGIDDQSAVSVEPDRQSAINLAVERSRPGDVLLLAGKGHETTQTIGTTVLEFDDRVAAVEALQRAGF